MGRKIIGAITRSQDISGNIRDPDEISGGIRMPEREVISQNDYNLLINKPKIEGITLEGDKSFEELTLISLTNAEIEQLLSLE